MHADERRFRSNVLFTKGMTYGQVAKGAVGCAVFVIAMFAIAHASCVAIAALRVAGVI